MLLQKVMAGVWNAAAFTVVSSWIARSATIVVSLITIPLMLGTLSVEEYAVYAITASLNMWLALSDFGMGKAIQNSVAAKSARSESVCDVIVTTNILLLGTAAVAVAVLYSCSRPASEFLYRHAMTVRAEEKERIFFIGASLMAITGCSSAVFREWYALLKGYVGNLVTALAHLGVLLGCIIVASSGFHGDRLYAFIVASFLPVSFCSLAAIAFMTIHHYRLGGRFRWGLASEAIRQGRAFFCIGALSSLALGLDYIIISQFLDPEAIVTYNIAARIFAAAYVMYGAILLALWPALTRHAVQGNLIEFSRITRRALLSGVWYMGITTLVALFAINDLIRMLVADKSIVIPALLVCLFGGYYVIRVWTDVFSTVLHSQSDLATMYWIVPLQALIAVAVQLALVSRLSYYAVVAGLIVSFSSTVAWVLPMRARRHCRSNRGGEVA